MTKNRKVIPVRYKALDGKQRYFEDGDILELKEVDREGWYNKEFIFKNECEIEIRIWYSQVHRLYWDEAGNIYSPQLILPNGDVVNIVGLPVDEFKKWCEKGKLKVKRRNIVRQLYTSDAERFEDIFEGLNYENCVRIVREVFVKPFMEGDHVLKKEGGAWGRPLFDIEVLD